MVATVCEISTQSVTIDEIADMFYRSDEVKDEMILFSMFIKKVLLQGIQKNVGETVLEILGKRTLKC